MLMIKKISSTCVREQWSFNINLYKNGRDECMNLQLPNFKGHRWVSIGKSSRFIGQLALTVSLYIYLKQIVLF